jgi:tripartite-type tricarboxylate transporter receptor subunit TctC
MLATSIARASIRVVRFGEGEDGMGILSKALSIVAFVAAIAPTAHAADADKTWPVRTVRFIVPFPAGMAPDVAARLFADGLSKRWGQPVVIENRPGVDGSLGHGAFASANDDHTLLYGIAAALTINPLVQDKVPYDPVRDFVPISATADGIIVVAVNSGVPARSLSDLERLARAEPGKLLWGSGPSLPRFAFLAFLKTRGLDMPYVAYRDAATPPVDLGEGRVQMLVTMPTNAAVQAGKARIIAVVTQRRASTLPDVPTVVEAGYPEMSIDTLQGLFGWRGMPTALRDRISADVQAVAKDPGVRARLEATGQGVLGTTAAEFEAAIERQRVRVGEIARLVNLKAPTAK